MAEKVLLGMSGGVDSTVAGYLLKKAGYEVQGMTLWLWAPQEPYENPCCSVDAATLAAKELDIPHAVIQAQGDFRRLVVEPALAAYRRGLTPNPCAFCNREVRFALLVREAGRRGIRWVATGHHARVLHNEKAKLLRGRDREKDQSYFLFALTQEELSRALFPVGEYTKAEIKKIADEAWAYCEPAPRKSGSVFRAGRDFRAPSRFPAWSHLPCGWKAFGDAQRPSSLHRGPAPWPRPFLP
jgi:tRNA-specific 2-thiouridylase